MRETGTRAFCILTTAALVGQLDDSTVAALGRALRPVEGERELQELLRWAYALPDELRAELVERLRRKVHELRGTIVIRAGG